MWRKREKESDSVSKAASKEESIEHKTEENTSISVNASSGDVSSKGKTDTSSKPKGNGATSNNSSKRPPFIPQTGCQHTWVTRTETKQEPMKTIVTAERREYTLYRFYWYHTGKWEETRDHKRFDEWMKSENGSLYTILHPYPRPEDNPLFIKYDEHGHETYTNDHVIISNLFEWIPCEPYEKTEMTTVTVTSTICSKCGAIKYD